MFTTREFCRPGLHQVIRMFLLSCVLLPCLVLAGSAQATYTVTDLGTLPGGTASVGQGINASGQVTGWSYTDSTIDHPHAFLYTSGAIQPMVDLGDLGGNYSNGQSINASGKVTGWAKDVNGASHVFLYSGTMTDLRPDSFGNSNGYGINDSGWITGTMDIQNDGYHAFLYDPNTHVMTDLTPGVSAGRGNGINSSGWVTGYYGPVQTVHAFLYTGDVPTDLGTLLGGTYSEGFGINASGQITGFGDTSGHEHAFLYSNGTLTDIDSSGNDSQGLAINACGQIVGARGGRAFLYGANKVMIDLNTLIPSDSGWVLNDATAINDSGQITGYGSYDGAQVRAFLLTPVSHGAFVCTGNMREPRSEHAATLLSGGNTVLITGGWNSSGGLNTADVYDSTSGSFSRLEHFMSSPRLEHTATLLDNGKVLIAGGYDNAGGWPTSVELYDPFAVPIPTFTPTGSMPVGRQNHTATLLDNGKVLITGGLNGTSKLSSAELYDPGTEIFTPTSNSMSSPRYGHVAALLGNGKVLITGGCTGSNPDCVDTAELYDSATNTFSSTGAMQQAHAWHTATLLSNGTVLISGGVEGGILFNSAELYDPTAGTFRTTTGQMVGTNSFYHTGTILLDGSVLIAGGTWPAVVTNQAQLYDPIHSTFSLVTGTMSSPRWHHTATRLGNGQVLVTGGEDASNTVLASADLYQAPESITQPLSSGGGTASFIFNNNVYNIVYQYPAGYVPDNTYSLTVTPIQTSQADWAARTPPGNEYAGTQLAPVTGLGGDGIVYRAVCADTATGTNPCPAPSTNLFYITNTSWSGPVGANPGFLKATIGLNDWENVFVSFSPTRTDGGPDPTGGGKSNGGWSDWAFVYGVSQSSPATITINSPANNAPYAVNRAVSAAYSCTGSAACIGDVASGSPIDTASVGAKTFTVVATVTSGKSASQTVNYTVFLPTLTVTAPSITKILDAFNPALNNVTYSGFLPGENESNSLGGTLTCTTTAATTSPVGNYPITCSGLTSSKYAISYVQGTLTILYAPAGGTCAGDSSHSILQPINADGTSVWKQGRTIPAKFRVCDANGVSIGTPGVVASFNLIHAFSGTVTLVDETIVSTSADTAFRWDSTNQQWIFNISTSNLKANYTYVYAITLIDGSVINFQYGLR